MPATRNGRRNDTSWPWYVIVSLPVTATTSPCKPVEKKDDEWAALDCGEGVDCRVSFYRPPEKPLFASKIVRLSPSSLAMRFPGTRAMMRSPVASKTARSAFGSLSNWAPDFTS